MNIATFPVAYYDELGIWNLFSKHINERLPIFGASLNSTEGEILLPALPITFIPHAEAFWETSPEEAYLKPYLWIFVLKYVNHEIFKRDVKNKLKEFISLMQTKKIQWLVLFVPSLSRLVKSDHKSFTVSYEKVQNELQSMFGLKNTARFYCSTNKTYVDLDQPSVIKDEYWADFLKAVSKGVTQGIQSTILTLIEASAFNIHSNVFKYCLTQEALAFIYNLLGLKPQACSFYESLIDLEIDSSNFLKLSRQDLSQDFVMSFEEFRKTLSSKTSNQLSLLRYLFERQKEILLEIKNFDKISELALKFMQKSKRILFYVDELEFQYDKHYYIWKFGIDISDLLSLHIAGKV